ncbi:MAG: hypothetical protein IPM29_20410 [Planctomycetes bacterium]|nr:hypothetical protein [Planctomycetota bacterium]
MKRLVSVALVLAASVSAQNVSNVRNLIVNGDFDASQFNINPWFASTVGRARLTLSDVDGNRQPSQALETNSPTQIRQEITISTPDLYFACASIGGVGGNATRGGVAFEGANALQSLQWVAPGDPSVRVKACGSFRITAAPQTVRVTTSAQVSLYDNIELRRVRPDSLVLSRLEFVERDLQSSSYPPRAHILNITAEAGQGNPTVLLVSTATANVTVPGLVGELLLDPAGIITIDVAVNPIGDPVDVRAVVPDAVIVPGLPALWWQAFSFDVSAGVVRASDVAFGWSFQR